METHWVFSTTEPPVIHGMGLGDEVSAPRSSLATVLVDLGFPVPIHMYSIPRWVFSPVFAFPCHFWGAHGKLELVISSISAKPRILE